MLIELAQSGNDIDHEVAAERVEELGPVELDGADAVGDADYDVGVCVGRHF